MRCQGSRMASWSRTARRSSDYRHFPFAPDYPASGRNRQKRGISFHVSPASEFIRISSASNESVSFQRDIYPIFERSCLFCHGPEKQKAGFRADERSDFFRDDRKGPLVLPGNSGESRLVAIVSGVIRMKRNASDHVLSAQEVALSSRGSTRCPLKRRSNMRWNSAHQTSNRGPTIDKIRAASRNPSHKIASKRRIFYLSRANVRACSASRFWRLLQT